MRRVVAFQIAFFLLWVGQASAYNYNTHSKIVQRAVEAMEALNKPNPPAPSPPSGVTAAQFQAYLNDIKQVPDRLDEIGTGLPNKLPSSGLGLIPGGTGGEENFPFDVDSTNADDAAKCTFDVHDDLSDLSAFSIKEFRYSPKNEADPCALTPLQGNDSSLGPVLGWHAQAIDDHFDDAVMWFKPTNAGALSIIKGIAIDATNAVIGAVVAGFYCAAKFILGDSCDPDEIFHLAERYNPIMQLDGLLPGFGEIRSPAFTGLWHYFQFDGVGQYNSTPGMYYPNAGPDESPGAFDLSIMAGADISGMSLNAYESDGDDIYGDYDEQPRDGEGPWQVYSFPHIEFSPLNNLAKYGWEKQYLPNGNDASGLGWPLHAIGDAVEPHHVVATSAHGHVPLEEAVDDRLGELFPDESTARRAQLERIIREGFFAWQVLQSPNADVSNFLKALGLQTRQRVADNGDWPYEDILSTEEATGFAFLAEELALSGVRFDRTRELLELGSGATIGFLALAADHAHTAGGHPRCPGAQEYDISVGCTTISTTTCPIAESQCTSVAQCGDPNIWVCNTGCCMVQVQ